MHESAIVESMLGIVLRHAQRANAIRVLGVNLILGQFSHESDEAIQFYWDTLSAGTLAQGAALRFDRAPAEMQCLDCGRTFSASDHITGCPACLGPRVKAIHGDLVRVDSIEVE